MLAGIARRLRFLLPWESVLFPELRHTEPRRRAAALGDAARMAVAAAPIRAVAAYVAPLVAILLVMGTLRLALRGGGLVVGAVATLLGALLTIALARLALPLALRGAIRRLLREELVAEGVVLCLGCGYDLRAIAEAGDPVVECPECGMIRATSLGPGLSGAPRRGG